MVLEGRRRWRRGPDALEVVLWVAGLVLVSGTAWAFGPPTHVSLGLDTLRYLGLLPAAVRSVLRQFPHSFLYGTFAADAVVAKNLTRYTHHCHNWDVGFRMLEQAESDKLRAMVWGFLGHLAADVVAHNYYVPYHVITSYRAQTTRHIYWELRFDRFADSESEVWELLGQVGQHKFSEEDAFLQAQLSRSSRLLPFEASQRIFNSIVLVSRTGRWRSMMAAAADRSAWRLEESEFYHVKGLALNAMFSLFIDGRQAKVVRSDPTARQVLGQARRLRRSLRRWMRRGRLGPELCGRALRLLEDSLVAGLSGPARLPTAADLVRACGGHVSG